MRCAAPLKPLAVFAATEITVCCTFQPLGCIVAIEITMRCTFYPFRCIVAIEITVRCTFRKIKSLAKKIEGLREMIKKISICCCFTNLFCCYQQCKNEKKEYCVFVGKLLRFSRKFY